MRAALRIAWKDVTLRLRDRSAIIWGIVAPLLLASVFSLILGEVTDPDAIDVTIAVVDEDGGEVGQGFIAGLRDLDEQGVFDVVFGASAAEAEQQAADGEVDAAIVIPAGFTSAVARGAASEVLVVGYVDSPIGSQVARAVATGFAGEVNGISVAVGTAIAASGGAPDDLDALVAGAAAAPTPLGLDTETEASKELSASTFYAAAMAVFFLFFTVQFGVIGLLEERTQGTMARLLAAPIPRASIIFGKAITSFVLGIVSMAVLVIVTSLLPFMDADWGDPIGVAILVVSGVLAAMGVMTIVATFAKTPETATNIQAVVAFLLGMLGGAFFPLSQLGGVVARLSLLTPHAWFLRGLGDLAAGGGPGDILVEAGFILLFAVVTTGVALTRLRRTVEL
jgi:ABC-2 type transport system permease protein